MLSGRFRLSGYLRIAVIVKTGADYRIANFKAGSAPSNI
jgi:hypothetical protein